MREIERASFEFKTGFCRHWKLARIIGMPRAELLSTPKKKKNWPPTEKKIETCYVGSCRAGLTRVVTQLGMKNTLHFKTIWKGNMENYDV